MKDFDGFGLNLSRVCYLREEDISTGSGVTVNKDKDEFDFSGKRAEKESIATTDTPIEKELQQEKPESRKTAGLISLQDRLRKIGGKIKVAVELVSPDGNNIIAGKYDFDTDHETEYDLYDRVLKSCGSGEYKFHFVLNGETTEWTSAINNPLYPNKLFMRSTSPVKEQEKPVVDNSPVLSAIERLNDNMLNLSDRLENVESEIQNKEPEPKVTEIVKTGDSEETKLLREELRLMKEREKKREEDAKLEAIKRESKENLDRLSTETKAGMANLEKLIIENKNTIPAKTPEDMLVVVLDKIKPFLDMNKSNSQQPFGIKDILAYIPQIQGLISMIRTDPMKPMTDTLALLNNLGFLGGGNANPSPEKRTFGNVMLGIGEKIGEKVVDSLDPEALGAITKLVLSGGAAGQPVNSNPSLPTPAKQQEQIDPNAILVTNVTKKSTELIHSGDLQGAATNFINNLPPEMGKKLATNYNDFYTVLNAVDGTINGKQPEMQAIFNGLQKYYGLAPQKPTRKPVKKVAEKKQTVKTKETDKPKTDGNKKDSVIKQNESNGKSQDGVVAESGKPTEPASKPKSQKPKKETAQK